MNIKERILAFTAKYSPNEIVSSFEELIGNIITNIVNSGSITIQIILSPLLLACVALLLLLIALKKLSLNFFDLLRHFFKLMRKMLAVAIKEINEYWQHSAEVSKVLKSNLGEAIRRMFNYVRFLSHKVFNDGAKYTGGHTVSHVSLMFDILTSLLIFLLSIAITFIMTVILALTFFTGLPIVHRALMGRSNQSLDTVSKAS